MDNLCERIIELLGKDVSDSICAKFVVDLGETPESTACAHLFLETGFWLFCAKGRIVGVEFYITRPIVQDYFCKPYEGTLPGGLVKTDKRDDIQRKLGRVAFNSVISPDANSRSSESYLFSNYVLMVRFDASSEKLYSVIVGTKPDSSHYEILPDVSPKVLEANAQTSRGKRRLNHRKHKHY